MYKRILVAVDGSPTADQALQEAIKLAREVNARLRIVHVVDVINISFGATLPTETSIEQASKKGEEILRMAREVAHAASVPAESQLLVSDTLSRRVPERIAADAEAWPADLIVICTHGRSGLSHLLLGSVAEGVIRLARKPVLLIRGK